MLAREFNNRPCHLLAAYALTAAMLCSAAVHAAPRTFQIDPDHLFVTFLVSHGGFAKIVGQFLRGDGRLVYDEEAGTIESGTVTVYSKSVFTGHHQRDKMLRGPDFLHVSQYPEIVFELSSFDVMERFAGRQVGQLSGQLTMRGITRPVTFNATINRIGPRTTAEDAPYILGASARMTIARSRWAMGKGIGSGELADGVELIIEVEARRVR